MPRLLSPSRLNDFLGCEHRTYLDVLVEQGRLAAADDGRPSLERLKERGIEHEALELARYEAAGREVVRIPEEGTLAERAAATVAAMQRGAEVIHQACLMHDGWLGFADFLERVEQPSARWPWSYEVLDAKLARDAKPAYVFQLLFYDRELGRLQGSPPERMHLLLGDGTRESFPPAEFEAYGEHVRGRFEQRRAELAAGHGAAVAYPYEVAQCDLCPWWQRCADRRRADDHVSLVANVHRGLGRRLEAEGITTLGALAQLPGGTDVRGVATETLLGARLQAELQLRSRGKAVPEHELLQPEHGRGLHRLPRPSPADVHFDFEGDPHWGEGGLEYLFGTLARDLDGDGQWRYEARWATDRAEERAAFEAWIDWLRARLDAHPDLHVFHYNTYEVTALKALALRHSTREAELDELLRRNVFVDLYGVVRQGLRIGVASYGLKGIEPVHGFVRTAGRGSLRNWARFLETGDRSLLDDIAAYNEEDCRSTESLHRWLLDRRPEAESRFGLTLATLAPEEDGEMSDGQRRHAERLEAVRDGLIGDLPADEESGELDDEQRARRTLFDVLSYFRREDRPFWWNVFSKGEMSRGDLREDGEVLGDLRLAEGTSARVEGDRVVWELTYDEQDHKVEIDGGYDELGHAITVASLDEHRRHLVVTRAKEHGDVPPVAVLSATYFNRGGHETALFDLADRVTGAGLEPCGTLDAAVDVLLRRAPRFVPGTPPLDDRPVDLDRLAGQVAALEDSALVIQGPPGTGKTYTGARIAVALLERGLTVGVTATGHKAILNMLEEIDRAADERDFDFVGWKKGNGGTFPSRRFVFGGARPPGPAKGGPPVCVGATTWHWVGAGRGTVDVLLVDEAGQVSLADALAVAGGARSVVLLGDPQQLPHVSQATHPHGAGVSVLRHLLGERDVVDERSGVLLRRSWRMHPDVCRFVSDTMYEGKLESVEACARQRVTSPGLTGTGLRLLAVAHEGNRQRSPEEAEAIARQLELLVGGRFTGADGAERALTWEDVMVVAPYNAQVKLLKQRLPAAEVGTVDKFQGRQAPVVLFSMTSSSGDDVPRGMDFLFSRERLNVAVSRAQALAVVVCSPALLSSPCRTIEDMRRINMLCRFAAAAEAV